MTQDEIERQIVDAVARYSDEPEVQAGVLSGISLAANFLAKSDGSRTVTPQAVLNAAVAVANRCGWSAERLKKDGR